MKEEPLLLLSDLQKFINQVVCLIDYTIIILGGEHMTEAEMLKFSVEEFVQLQDYMLLVEKDSKAYGS